MCVCMCVCVYVLLEAELRGKKKRPRRGETGLSHVDDDDNDDDGMREEKLGFKVQYRFQDRQSERYTTLYYSHMTKNNHSNYAR